MGIKKLLISNLPLIILILLLIPFYALLYKIYIPRVSAFGCFDDCFNYLGGYFIANGKVIYKDFFFNHQPITAILSYVIQSVTHPINIFELILRHRQFLLLFGFLFNALFIIRFRYMAILFILAFELSKFYIFGDRFLAEGLIIYPLIYLFGLALLKLSKRKLYAIDYTLSAIFSWFVIFSREPYVPLALLLLAVIFWGKLRRIKIISFGLFGLFSAVILLCIGDMKEYYFNIVTFNLEAVLPRDINVKMWGPKPLQIFLYPIYILFYGDLTIFKKLLMGFDLIFLVYLVLLMRKHSYKLVIFIILTLGLANFRIILPGTNFYESFHLIIWYGLFIFTISFLIFHYSNRKSMKFFSILAFGLILLVFVSDKSFFAKEKVDRQAEFINNFGHILQDGEVIKILSDKRDSLFLERSDDLIYWQADRLSSYKYTWYTSQMNYFPKYQDARVDMFRNNPPVFYREFGICPKKDIDPSQTLPLFVKDKYTRLYNGKDPSCLYIRNEKIKGITSDSWQKAEELFKYGLKPAKQ